MKEEKKQPSKTLKPLKKRPYKDRVLVWKEHAETAKARDKQRQTLLESGTLKELSFSNP